MSKTTLTTAASISLMMTLITSPARAQSASGADAEIALLKQQLKLMEQKLDKLQKHTVANTAAAATANAKVDAKVKADTKAVNLAGANANTSYPVKGLVAPSGVVVTMPNNRPTICTADDQNCIAITSRIHFDVVGYDYRPTGAYVTGPTTGAIHSASSVNPNGTTEQLGTVARIAGQLVSGPNYSFHLGADAGFLLIPPHNKITGAETLTFSDRPELRIDPTQLISTGAIANVSDAQVYGVEAAGAYGPLFFQGEYYWFNVERNAATSLPPIGAPNLKFDGGYAEATFVLTGETHNTTISLARQPALPVDASGSIQPA